MIILIIKEESLKQPVINVFLGHDINHYSWYINIYIINICVVTISTVMISLNSSGRETILRDRSILHFGDSLRKSGAIGLSYKW